MDKRMIILVCICAVGILIGLSFTSVVGYSSKQSNSIGISPLYNLRTNRAINNREDVATYDYVGKGKASSVNIPVPDSGIVLIKHLIDRINNMNYKTFNSFIALAIKRIKHSEKGKDVNIDQLLTTFYLIRTNPEKLENYIKKKSDDILVDEFTSGELCEPWRMGNSKLGDIFWFIIFIFALIIEIISLTIFNTFVILLSVLLPDNLCYSSNHNNCTDTEDPGCTTLPTMCFCESYDIPC
jgi:hypothetical protein